MNVGPLPIAFEKFRRDQSRALERIARRTRGTHDADDLASEAFFIAIKIAEQRDHKPLDLSLSANQQEVLARLFNKFVVYVNGKLRESIDDDSGDSRPWSERLAASSEANPLAQLERLDEENKRAIPPGLGFSQYSAYMVLLHRCEMDFGKVAKQLSISFAALRERIRKARDRASIQPSLFDGIEDVDADFLPKSAWIKRLWRSANRYLRSRKVTLDGANTRGQVIEPRPDQLEPQRKLIRSPRATSRVLSKEEQLDGHVSLPLFGN